MSQKFEGDIHPEEKSLLGFQILLRWLNPLIQLSNQRPLVDDDVWSPPTHDRVNQTAAVFWDEWEKEIDACEGWNDESIEPEKRKRSPSLLRVLFRTFGWKLALSGCVQIVFFLFQIGQPFLVGELVSYVQNGDGGIRVGIGYALGFAALSVCSSVCLAIVFDNTRRLGSVVRSVVMMAVYEQALKLTTAARMSNTIGQTTNLMSIDAEKLNLAVQFVHFLWHGPLLAIVITIIFIAEIGYAPALAGFGFFLVLFPLQNYLAKRVGQIRQKLVKFTDERVKLINEMLQSIRVIKLYAWEDALEKRVSSVRKQETDLLLSYLTPSGYLRELIFAVQPVVSLTIFCVATYAVRDPLTVPQFFRMIAFLNITRLPLNLLGQAMKNATDGMISVERLNRFFNLPTLRSIKSRKPVDYPQISIDHADFTWQDIKVSKTKGSTLPSKIDSPSANLPLINEDDLRNQNSEDHLETGTIEFELQDIENPSEESFLTYFRFSNLNFHTANSNDLIAVIGPVGSGKSSFMSALLGEMILQRGKSEISGTVSYCAQTPWIQNITLRQNVLFKVDQEHATEEVNQLYHASIEAAALLPDIKILPAGDMTEIGERGINLSGGQKARVSIARAFFTSYSSQICLFDDPFSAVDGNTGNAIFQRGILRLLENKLRIIALNSHMHLLKYFDRVVVLQNGRIFADGTLSELFNKYPDEMAKITGLKAEEILRSDAESNAEEGEELKKSLSARALDVGEASSSSLYAEVAASLERAALLRSNPNSTAAGTIAIKEQGTSNKPVYEKNKAISNKKEKKLISEEKADAGISTLVAYVKYFSASLTSVSKITRDPFYAKSSTKKVFSYSLIVRGSIFIFALIAIFSISQLVRVFVDLYLAKYVQHYLDGNNVTLYKNLYFGCFGIFIFSLLVRSTYLNIYSVRSSQVLHAYMLRRILSAPIPTFFDTHTLGAILNRFSKDIETVDVNIPDFMFQMIIAWFQVFSIFALCIWAAYYFVIILAPLIVGYYYVYKYFSCASKSLKQLESVSRSPIYSLLSETLAGLETIRAYGDTDRFLKIFEKRLNRNHKLMYHSQMVASWMTIRLELSTSLILLAIAVLTVTIRDIVSPISLGLALSYGLQLTALFQRCIQLLIEMTNYMHSTERVLEYLEKPQETNFVENKKPMGEGEGEGELIALEPTSNSHVEPSASKRLESSREVEERLKDWPRSGDIELVNVWMQYRDNPPVLKGLTVKIKGGQRIGVCGRTGAGKSSVMMALFRIVEISQGAIFIDGQDIGTIPLVTLRSHLAIIPQDPVLFTGDIRFQLDPFHQYSDEQIWEALQQVNLSETVKGLPNGLSEGIAENGENLSQGQRQLLCIARALLRKAKILIVDEGTSAVDPHTDELIQKVLRKEAYDNGTTVLAIAHRLQTIIDFDKILVLGQGQVLEYDSPENLLANDASTFSSMLKEASMH